MTQYTYTYTLVEQDLPTLTKPLGSTLRPGDVIALWGDLGVGKTTFARALIQGIVGKKIDVPSPTFTLVQVYDCQEGELWHCDLYRLKSPDESFELGLEDAFHEAICLLEWPEKLGDLLPARRIDVTFKIINETTREIRLNLVGPHDAISSALESTTSET